MWAGRVFLSVDQGGSWLEGVSDVMMVRCCWYDDWGCCWDLNHGNRCMFALVVVIIRR